MKPYSAIGRVIIPSMMNLEGAKDALDRVLVRKTLASENSQPSPATSARHAIQISTNIVSVTCFFIGIRRVEVLLLVDCSLKHTRKPDKAMLASRKVMRP